MLLQPTPTVPLSSLQIPAGVRLADIQALLLRRGLRLVSGRGGCAVVRIH